MCYIGDRSTVCLRLVARGTLWQQCFRWSALADHRFRDTAFPGSRCRIDRLLSGLLRRSSSASRALRATAAQLNVRLGNGPRQSRAALRPLARARADAEYPGALGKKVRPAEPLEGRPPCRPCVFRMDSPRASPFSQPEGRDSARPSNSAGLGSARVSRAGWGVLATTNFLLVPGPV